MSNGAKSTPRDDAGDSTTGPEMYSSGSIGTFIIETVPVAGSTTCCSVDNFGAGGTWHVHRKPTSGASG